jgi:hypothetical protein
LWVVTSPRLGSNGINLDYTKKKLFCVKLTFPSHIHPNVVFHMLHVAVCMQQIIWNDWIYFILIYLVEYYASILYTNCYCYVHNISGCTQNHSLPILYNIRLGIIFAALYAQNKGFSAWIIVENKSNLIIIIIIHEFEIKMVVFDWIKYNKFIIVKW